MSLYKQHKNGVGISWDNYYAAIDTQPHNPNEPRFELPEGVKEFRDGYNAIVSLAGYDFDAMTTATVGILTPAQQLVYVEKTVHWIETIEIDGKTLNLPYQNTHVVVASNVERWLNEKVGAKHKDWDIRSRDSIRNAGIFFRRRTDAMAFIKMVNGTLAGMKFSEY